MIAYLLSSVIKQLQAEEIMKKRQEAEKAWLANQTRMAEEAAAAAAEGVANHSHVSNSTLPPLS